MNFKVSVGKTTVPPPPQHILMVSLSPVSPLKMSLFWYYSNINQFLWRIIMFCIIVESWSLPSLFKMRSSFVKRLQSVLTKTLVFSLYSLIVFPFPLFTLGSRGLYFVDVIVLTIFPLTLVDHWSCVQQISFRRFFVFAVVLQVSLMTLLWLPVLVFTSP